MKLAIKNIKGAVTSYDEDDLNLETAIQLDNFKIYSGYIKANIPSIDSLYQDNLYKTKPHLYLPVLDEGWEWETGLITNVSNDILGEDTDRDEFTVLLLVAKHTTTTSTSRTIWFRKWTENISDEWTEPILGGYNAPAYSFITSDMLTTLRTGKTFFKVEDGIIKIFMPHDSFWFGYLNRTWNVSSNWSDSTISPSSSINDFYLDRLVENAIPSNMEAKGSTDGELYCASGYRLGVSLSARAVTEAEAPIQSGDTIKFIKISEEEDDTGMYGNGKTYIVAKAEIQGGDYDGYIKPNPLNSQYPGGNTNEWHFIEKYHSPTSTERSWILPSEVEEFMTIDSGTDYFADADTYKKRRPTINAAMLAISNLPWVNEVGYTEGGYEDFWVFPNSNGSDIPDLFNTTLTYTLDKGTVDDDGFTGANAYICLAVTAVLDETTEIIINQKKIDTADVASYKYGLNVTIELPLDLNRRVTRLKLYAKESIVKGADYYLVEEYDLIGDTMPRYTNLVIGESSITNSGVTLSQNIGIFYDEREPNDYKILTGFSSIATKDRISIGLKYDDTSNIYYSVLGGGNLQNDLIYKANILDISFSSKLTAVTAIGNNLAVIGNDEIFILRIDIISTSLIFSKQDALEFGIRSIENVREVQGGVIIHTPLGIFLTNGYEKTWLSEAINEEIKNNYNSNVITYNKYLQELYVWAPGETTKYWKYSFERKNWEKILVGDGILHEILIDLNGKTNFLVNEVRTN